MLKRRIVFVACAWAACGARSQAQPALSWTRVPDPNPIARLESPMVYDSGNQRMVIFGGYDHNQNRDAESWEYDGVTRKWKNVTPLGLRPPRRAGHTTAYDPVGDAILMFGGQLDNGTYLNDTWEWNAVAKTWTNVTPAGTDPALCDPMAPPPASFPCPRRGTRMVYDAANARIVLYGGLDFNRLYGDTWVWNLAARTWTPLATVVSSPFGRTMLKRGFHQMTYNTNTNRVTLFGGTGFAPPPLIRNFQDTWELQGTTWTDITPSDDPTAPDVNDDRLCTGTCPPGRSWSSLAYDPALNRLVLYGGWSNENPANGGIGFFSYGDTWAFSYASSTWTQIATVAQGTGQVRDSHAIVYDANRNKIVLFGGYLADVWELTNNTWAAVPGHNPPVADYLFWPAASDQNGIAYDSLRGKLHFYLAGAAEMFELSSSLLWSTGYNAGGPNGRVRYGFAYHAPNDKVVLFGGRTKTSGALGSVQGDTWLWNPTTHTWAAGAAGPGVRELHAMAYDAARANVVMFGGRNAAGTPLGDTWIWNGSAWSPGPSGTPGVDVPQPRFGHAMAYDLRGVVVLFGGEDGVTRFNEIWEWNGSAWTKVVPALGSVPSPRAGSALCSMATDLGGVLMFGGRDGTGLRNDAWVWIGTQWVQVAYPGLAPSPREFAKAVFFPALGKAVLEGGLDANGVAPGDVWLASLFAKGDMNRNRTTDLLLRDTVNTSVKPLVWQMSGTTRVGSFSLANNPAANEAIAGLDDFNYDDRNDLVLWNSATGAVTFWFLNSDGTRLGTAALGGAAPLSTAWKLAATSDFTHDGKPDLVWRNSVTQKLAVWRLSGTTKTGELIPNPDQAIDANWEVVGALDFNADGDTDLLWYNPNSGKIVFWFLDANLQRTTGQFAVPSNAGDNNWKVLAAGDYGVGAGGLPATKDLVWRNATSGRFVVWHMNTAGARTFGTFTTPNQPDTTPLQWTIAGPR